MNCPKHGADVTFYTSIISTRGILVQKCKQCASEENKAAYIKRKLKKSQSELLTLGRA